MRVSGIPYVQGRNSYSDRDGEKYGIAIHNTSNTATAEGEAAYASRRTDGTSAHFYVDNDSVIQSLDTAARAGHSGSTEGNENAVSVEIAGLNSWSREKWVSSVDWPELGKTLAAVCKRYGTSVRRASVAEMRSNPKVRAFYSHDDMRQAWGGTTHTDPGPNFPWDVLFKSVNAALGTTTGGGGNMPELSQNYLTAIARIDATIDAWNRGMETTHDGRPMRPVTWQIRNEAFQAEVRATLAALTGKDWVDEAEIAAQILAALGAKPLAETAATLRAALGDERAAELGALLSGPAQG